MRTHYAIVDDDGDVLYIGPGRGFPSKAEAEAEMFLLFCVPVGEGLDWHIEPFDPDALPLPTQPRMPS